MILNGETYLPADETTIYGTSSENPALSSDIVITFPVPVQYVSFNLYNCETIPAKYSISAITLFVPFGQMEERPRMTEEEKKSLLSRNRERFCATVSEDGVSSAKQQPSRGEKGGLTEPELL